MNNRYILRYSLIIATLFLFVAPKVSAQTHLKTNALYLAALVPNIAIETRLNSNFTFEAEAFASLWKSINDKPYLVGALLVGSRYYLKESFKGFYIGAYASGEKFKFSKWNYTSDQVQRGLGMCLGGTIGYQFAIGPKCNMDLYFGGGFHHAWYWGETLSTGEQYVGWNKSAEWLPYRAGVSFAFTDIFKRRK